MLRPACSLALVLLWAGAVEAGPPALRSAHAIVVDDATGEVLLQKNGDTAAPIASLTKLLTAMVVIDARQDPDELLRVTPADRDGRSSGGLRVGALASRGSLLELALMASDNHAAAALARHYPGGLPGFHAAMQRKLASLQLTHTVIEEPTGLSAGNVSSAQDLAKVLRAAATYPLIAEITSRRSQMVRVNGRPLAVHNTNPLVGTPGWNILLSKTGFTNDAGRCLSMRLEAAGRTVSVVLLGAVSSAQRAVDALQIRHWLGRAEKSSVAPAPAPAVAAAVTREPPRRARVLFATARERDGVLEPRPGFLAERAEPAASASAE
jgi:D-alanyl-D-alanine carboxypeptidase/D-alanyl-D-alanine endopeptidase (penicillin-binding protein 7)